MSRTWSWAEEKDISEEGERRLVALLRWVHDHPIDTALLYWRNEVLGRLPAGRPIIVSIPNIFVQKCPLGTKKVFVGPDNEVYELLSHTNRKKITKGRLLVPAQKTALTPERDALIPKYTE